MTVRIVVLGDHPARHAVPEGTSLVFAPRSVAERLAAENRPACPALAGRLPLRTAAADEVILDRSLHPEDLAAALPEAARTLAPGGTLQVEARLRSGTAGTVRSLLASLLRLPRPHAPDELPARLLGLAFDRIEQRVHGSLGRYRARRLPGRPWDLIRPPER